MSSHSGSASAQWVAACGRPYTSRLRSRQTVSLPSNGAVADADAAKSAMRRTRRVTRATTALRKLDAERDSVAYELDSAAENRATLQQAYEQSEARQLEAEKSQADIEAKLQATIAQRDSMSAEASGLRQAFEQAQAGRAAL